MDNRVEHNANWERRKTVFEVNINPSYQRKLNYCVPLFKMKEKEMCPFQQRGGEDFYFYNPKPHEPMFLESLKKSVYIE